MKKLIVAGLISGVLGCQKVPITGRRQVNLLPESQLMGMSLTNYNQFLKENKTVDKSDPRAQMVDRVGKKIQFAVQQFLKKEHQLKRIEGYKWEFNLVDDNVVNAWCMPGGKVVFYTGILPITLDETGMAVVMGHEIAHAIARHGNERMSQGLITQAGGIGLSVLLSTKPKEAQDLFMGAYGVGTGLGSLKLSRNHESEADKMGLIFMAMAGYDPDEAVNFWARMKQNGGNKPPEFLSTHPHEDTRIEDIKASLPEARIYYQKAKKAGK